MLENSDRGTRFTYLLLDHAVVDNGTRRCVLDRVNILGPQESEHTRGRPWHSHEIHRGAARSPFVARSLMMTLL